jgi:signal transduction histidine kinase
LFLRWAVGLLAVVAAVASFTIAQGSGRFTTYAGVSGGTLALTIGAGLALVLGGIVSLVGQHSRRVGDLALVAGLLWFAPVFVGWQDAPAAIRSGPELAAAFLMPVLVHLVLAWPGGPIRPATERVLVGTLYLGTTIAAIGLALVRDPFFDLRCWANCGPDANPFLVRSVPSLARTLDAAGDWLLAASAVVFVLLSLRRLGVEIGRARWESIPVALAGIVLGLTVIGGHVVSLPVPTDRPTLVAAFAIQGMAVIALGAAIVVGALAARVTRRALAQIVTSLGEAPPPGSLQAALAHALDDPDLRVVYPVATGFVDADGKPVLEPAPGSPRAVTALVRDGRRIAVISHASTLAELEREIGAAVRLGIENERLRAEVLAHLVELRASRTRIVETGDAERQRLERDLHDGAQQRLLALSYDIRRARAAAEADGDTATSPILAAAVDVATAALAELRELAHGIYPAILEAAGLASALENLADEAALKVDLRADVERCDGPVENAAYGLVAEALDEAASRGASKATVSAERDSGRLVVTVADDGPPRTSSLVAVADRIGAVGGQMWLDATEVRAELPCASL